jgi:hypothetical protein
MLVYNDLMTPYLNLLEFDEWSRADEALLKVSAKGFVEADGCYFLKAIYKKSKVSQTDFPDKTGYECFVNAFHIDDYVAGNYLREAFLFAKEMFAIWDRLRNKLVLTCIVAKTDHGANIRFHVKRKNETYIKEDDLYEADEAICIITSGV